MAGVERPQLGETLKGTNPMRKNIRSLAVLAAIALLATLGIENLNSQTTAPATAPAAPALPKKVDSDLDGISIELVSVERAPGDTILIKFKYISTRENVTRIDTEAGQSVESIYYIDPKNKKKYVIIKDDNNQPVSSSLYELEVPANGTKSAWAKFPAPPADVTSISVYLTGAPPFENVPIAPAQ